MPLIDTLLQQRIDNCNKNESLAGIASRCFFVVTGFEGGMEHHKVQNGIFLRAR